MVEGVRLPAGIDPASLELVAFSKPFVILDRFSPLPNASAPAAPPLPGLNAPSGSVRLDMVANYSTATAQARFSAAGGGANGGGGAAVANTPVELRVLYNGLARRRG